MNDKEEIQETLGAFVSDNWKELSWEEREQATVEFQRFQAELLGLDPPPEVEFYDNPEGGDYGAYYESENVIRINRAMM